MTQSPARLKRLAVAAILILAAPVAGACGGDDGGEGGEAAAPTATRPPPHTATASATQAPASGRALSIHMTDFAFDPKDAAAKAGKVTIAAPNDGEVVHELVLLKTDEDPAALPKKGSEVDESTSVGEIADVPPGSTKEATFDLAPGKYAMVCALPGHYEKGMYGSLEVDGGCQAAVGLGGELPAGGVDVAAAGQAHGGVHPVLLERGLERGDRLARGALVGRVGRVERDQVDLEDLGVEQLRELDGLRVAVVDAGEHHVLDEDLAAADRVVAPAGLQHVRERVAVVDRHDPRAQRVLGGVQRERQPDRHVGLRERLDAGLPADRGDRRAAVGDPDVGQPPRAGEHVVEVHHRLAHAHVDQVVTGSMRRKCSTWSRISLAVRLRPNFIAPVAQNVHVSGQPDCEETQIERRPSR